MMYDYKTVVQKEGRFRKLKKVKPVLGVHEIKSFIIRSQNNNIPK